MAILPWCCTTGIAPFRASRLSEPSATRPLHRISAVFSSLSAINNTNRTIALSIRMKSLRHHEPLGHHPLFEINHHHHIDTQKSSHMHRTINKIFAKIQADMQHLADAQKRHKASAIKAELHNMQTQSHERFYGQLAQIVTIAPSGANENNNPVITDRKTTVKTRYNAGATTRTETTPVKETTFLAITVISVENSYNLSKQKAFRDVRLQFLKKFLDEEDDSEIGENAVPATEQATLPTVERQNISIATALAELYSQREKNQKNARLRHQAEPAGNLRKHNAPAVVAMTAHNRVTRDDKALETDTAADSAINAIAHDRQMNTNNHRQNPDKDYIYEEITRKGDLIDCQDQK